MAKTWKQICDEMGKIHPKQSMEDFQEMLDEKGMTRFEFWASKEFIDSARENAEAKWGTPPGASRQPE